MKVLDVRADSDGPELIYAEQERTYAEQEVKAWRQAGIHKNILGLCGAVFERGLCIMVMEVCDTKLQHFLEAGAGEGKLTELAVRNVIHQSLEACVHLCERHVVHRDVKPENLLLCKGTVKLIDFGLAATLEPGERIKGVNGTPAFMAPEMVCRHGYDYGVDVWSLGIITYVLLFGEYPYRGKEHTGAAMKEVIATGSRLPPFKPSLGDFPRGVPAQPREAVQLAAVSNTAVEFAKALLTRKQKHRPTAAEALRHGFMTQAACTSDLPDLMPTLESAVACGAFGKPAKQLGETVLDDYVDYLRKKPARGSVSTPLMKWRLDEPSQVELSSVDAPKHIGSGYATPPTPSDLGSAWAQSDELVGVGPCHETMMSV